MRILYFYQYFGTSKGGWSTRVYEMTRRWVASGAEVTVVTSMYDKSDLVPSGFITNLDIDGVKVKLVNIRLSNKHSFIKRLYSFFAFSFTAIWYALTVKTDVIIASSGPLTIGIPGILAKILRGKPFIFEIRDLWPTGAIELGALKNKFMIRMAKWLELICYKKADHVIAASVGQLQHVKSLLPNTNVSVITNGSDNHLIREMDLRLNLPEWALNKKLVIYAGTLGLIDDCATVVYLAKEFEDRKRNEIEVVLVGDGKERNELEKLAGSLALKNIHFMGQTSKENVMRWLTHSHISLLTVKNVKFLDTASPNKIFDAFAAGIPMVQNTQGWIKEYFEQRRCGLTVPQSNPSAMADAILRILDEPGLWLEMSENARKAALEDFDRDKLSSKMLDIIEETVSLKK
jgi:glycosyltransferase involved in cell wall biosynthesis